MSSMLLLRATWYLRITSDISSAAPSDKSSYSHPTKGEQKCGKHPKLYVCSILLGPRNAGIRWRWYTIVYQYRDELTVPFPSCSARIGVARIAATRSSLESLWVHLKLYTSSCHVPFSCRVSVDVVFLWMDCSSCLLLRLTKQFP